MFKLRLFVVFAAALVVAYDLAVRLHFAPAGPGVTQPQTNGIRLERFALDHHPQDIVLVGSSLVANLQREPRVGNVVSLGLEGHSPLTGLHAVVSSGASPRAVVIEVADPLWKKVDDDLVADSFGPWSGLKRVIPSLQTQFSPFVVLHGLLKKKLSKGDTEPSADPGLLSQLIRREKDQRLQPFDRKELDNNRRNLELLAKDVGELERRGTTVRFVRIPREKDVDDTPRNREAVAAVEKLFGPYKWVRVPSPQPLQTRDALHMVRAQADRFKSELLRSLDLDLLCLR
jgi:hypothetical protein